MVLSSLLHLALWWARAAVVIARLVLTAMWEATTALPRWVLIERRAVPSVAYGYTARADRIVGKLNPVLGRRGATRGFCPPMWACRGPVQTLLLAPCLLPALRGGAWTPPSAQQYHDGFSFVLHWAAGSPSAPAATVLWVAPFSGASPHLGAATSAVAHAVLSDLRCGGAPLLSPTVRETSAAGVTARGVAAVTRYVQSHGPLGAHDQPVPVVVAGVASAADHVLHALVLHQTQPAAFPVAAVAVISNGLGIGAVPAQRMSFLPGPPRAPSPGGPMVWNADLRRRSRLWAALSRMHTRADPSALELLSDDSDRDPLTTPDATPETGASSYDVLSTAAASSLPPTALLPLPPPADPDAPAPVARGPDHSRTQSSELESNRGRRVNFDGPQPDAPPTATARPRPGRRLTFGRVPSQPNWDEFFGDADGGSVSEDDEDEGGEPATPQQTSGASSGRCTPEFRRIAAGQRQGSFTMRRTAQRLQGHSTDWLYRTGTDAAAPSTMRRGAPAVRLNANLEALLGAVRVPLLVLHAADDPVIPAASLPLAALQGHPDAVTVVTRRGGHGAFVDRDDLSCRAAAAGLVGAARYLFTGATTPAAAPAETWLQRVVGTFAAAAVETASPVPT